LSRRRLSAGGRRRRGASPASRPLASTPPRRPGRSGPSRAAERRLELASVSPQNPTMTSVETAMPGTASRIRSSRSR
jgi:hypothetical protein